MIQVFDKFNIADRQWTKYVIFFQSLRVSSHVHLFIGFSCVKGGCPVL